MSCSLCASNFHIYIFPIARPDFCGLQNINISLNVTYDLTSLPYYPYIYPNDAHCEWYITSLDTEYVVIQFYRLHTQTEKDFLHLGIGHNISSNTSILKLSGQLGPRIVSVNSSKLWILFTSDYGGRHFGFHVKLISSNTHGKMCIISPLDAANFAVLVATSAVSSLGIRITLTGPSVTEIHFKNVSKW